MFIRKARGKFCQVSDARRGAARRKISRKDSKKAVLFSFAERGAAAFVKKMKKQTKKLLSAIEKTNLEWYNTFV